MFDVEGTLDTDRLAAALKQVVQVQHPVAGCRLASYRGAFYRWQKIPYEPNDYLLGPFQERKDFDLYKEPPLRIHVGDGNVAFEMSHVAFDAIGFARLIRSVFQQYTALPRLIPPVLDEEALRWSGQYYGKFQRNRGKSPARDFYHPETGKILARLADPVAKTGDPEAIGTYNHHLSLPLQNVYKRANSFGCSVNALVMSGLLTQVVRWNAEHDSPARYLSVDIPVNLRPAERRWELAANVAGLITLNLLFMNSEPPELEKMVEKVSAEDRLAKEENRAWQFVRENATLKYPTRLVLTMARWSLRLLSRNLVVRAPTALVSNYGKIPKILGDFAGLRLDRLRVEGSAFCPLGLNVYSPNEEHCCLSFCVRRSHFSQESLVRFAQKTERLILEKC